MKGKFSINSVPIWLLSFLFVNILYMFFKDVVFYSVYLALVLMISYVKYKNKSPYIVLELIIFIVYTFLMVVCIINRDQIVLKLIIMNLGSWLFVYLFLKKSY